MSNDVDRSRNKEPVTIRLDVEMRADLQALAASQKRTVSSLIDQAVRNFLDQQQGRLPVEGKLRVRYALLPDTAVLYSFAQLVPERYRQALADAHLPELDFVERPAEWRNMFVDVFSGKSDIVETVNRLPIYWHVTRGDSSPPPLDWVGPYLQVFVGHTIFVHGDHLAESMPKDEIEQFKEFRNQARTGKDRSLRSLIAWAQHSPDHTERRVELLNDVWQNAIVGCQLGTDFHIAVRRVSAILAALARGDGEQPQEAPREPHPHGIENLARGFEDFKSGTLTAFAGNLLQAAELFTDENTFLMAGPADLRVPSLNTLAGRKGMFDAGGPSSGVGRGVLRLWCEAVSWFRDEVVADKDSDALKNLVERNFPQSEPRNDEQIENLRSLLQTWVKWFVDTDEAMAFMDDMTDQLVRHYQELGELLNPAATMTAPKKDDPSEAALWRFPSLPGRSAARLARVA